MIVTLRMMSLKREHQAVKARGGTNVDAVGGARRTTVPLLTVSLRSKLHWQPQASQRKASSDPCSPLGEIHGSRPRRGRRALKWRDFARILCIRALTALCFT
ncbi:hypothetical protein TorRG33x02_010020 [Trema orientale]|uniref:Uncharacterized protein n=1 Tax=Trema orientale TaxID=63057 RepID=A0A2P5FYR6_TREOI|nr:hypothetical protein TorRG33x02_010020 [Trema orientale]